MSLSIILAGATFLNPIASLVPVPSGLVNLFAVGATEAASKRSLTPSGAPAAGAVGVPVYNALSITTGQTKGAINTGIIETASYTEIVVAKLKKTGNSVLCGNFRGNAVSEPNVGSCIALIGGTLYSLTGSNTSPAGGAFGSTLQSVSAGVEGDMNFFAGTSDPVTGYELYWGKNGSTSYSQSAYDAAKPHVINTDRPLLIGNYPTNQYPGDAEVAMWGYWNRRLTPSEMAEVYAWCKAYLADRGVLTL